MARGRKNPRSKDMLQPATVDQGMIVRRKVRFSNSNSSAAVINHRLQCRDFADNLCVGTSATTASQLAVSFRIRALKFWISSYASTAPGSFGLQFLVNNTYVTPGGSQRSFSVACVSNSIPAYLEVKPLKTELAGQWLNAFAATPNRLLDLNVGAGTVVLCELDIEYVLNQNQTGQAVSAAVSGASIGQIYTRALDSASGTNLWPPVTGQGLFQI